MIHLTSRSDIGTSVRGFSLFLLLLIFFPIVVRASLPPLSGEALQSQAEIILTGTVAASRVLIVRKPGSFTYLIRLQAAVEKVEKGGELLSQAGITGVPAAIEVRCWQTRKSDHGETDGHREIPADGSRFRLWLKLGREGFWEPLEPNGIELLDQSPAMTFEEPESHDTARSFLIGLTGSLIIIGATAAFLFRRSRHQR